MIARGPLFITVAIVLESFLPYLPALAAAPGDLLSVEYEDTLTIEQLDTAIDELFEDAAHPASRYGADVFVIQYESTYPSGSPATITAQLFVPRIPETTAAPLYLFAPGTTGIIDQCSPSREHIIGVHWGLYRAHTLAFTGQGMVGLLPDYMGMGDPGELQPLFHADAGAHTVLDGIRAARAGLHTGAVAAGELRTLSSVFLAGYSQGGHAAFAAADYRNRYAPELPIDGIIGYGPTTNLTALIQQFVVATPMIAFSFRERYGEARFDPAIMLQDRWLESLEEDVTSQCVGGMQNYYSWNPSDMFREEFLTALREKTLSRDYPGIHAVLEQHTVGLSGHGVPALIVQGTEDIVVYPETQAQFVTTLRASGSDVRYYIYKDIRHDVRQAAFADVLDWIEERMQS